MIGQVVKKKRKEMETDERVAKPAVSCDKRLRFEGTGRVRRASAACMVELSQNSCQNQNLIFLHVK